MTRARDLAAFVSNADGDIKFDTDTLFIDSSANRVGIGTTTPSESLHIANANDAVALLESTGSDATDDANIQLKTTNGTFTIQNDRSIGTSGALTIAGNTSNNIVVDHNGGNVGIGTNNPDTKLHVEGNLLVDAYNNAGVDGGIFLREGFLTTAQPSVTLWDMSNSGASPDGLSLNANDGIRFMQGGSERARITNDGLQFNGDTAAANALDDYEEGYHQTTFTPSGSGSITLSGAHRYLRYTKIGNHVYISGKVDVSSVSSPVGYIKVSLPFAIDSASPAGANDSRRLTGSVWVTNASINVTEFILYGIEGESLIRIYRADGTVNASTSANTLSGNESVAFNFFYATAS